jgi:RimJ/RimL family protein N-acetyltransferase
MLDIQTQLFEGQDIRLGPIDHETHPEIESKWMHDAEFMRLLLRFAFAELNLFRVSAMLPEYNESAVRPLCKFGFRPEGRQRGAIIREGKRWDVLYMGILREEWLKLNTK